MTALRLVHRGVVAHEKPLPIPWVAARLLDPKTDPTAAEFPLPTFFVARPLDYPTGSFASRVDAARRALDCGDVAALLRRVDDPMTPSRFIGNLWHAFDDTRLRISAEPIDAVRQFCPS